MGLFRNDGATAAVLPTLGVTVEPGETVEHSEPIAGFVEVDVDGKVVEQPEPEPEDGYDSMLKAALEAEAEVRGLDSSGKKDELIARLREDDARA